MNSEQRREIESVNRSLLSCEAFEKEGGVEQTWVALGESDSGGEYHCRFCGANPGEECSDVNTATSYASRIHTERTETDEY